MQYSTSSIPISARLVNFAGSSYNIQSSIPLFAKLEQKLLIEKLQGIGKKKKNKRENQLDAS